eukprot:350853-Chlamydomonas_euryale.AAC.8
MCCNFLFRLDSASDHAVIRIQSSAEKTNVCPPAFWCNVNYVGRPVGTRRPCHGRAACWRRAREVGCIPHQVVFVARRHDGRRATLGLFLVILHGRVPLLDVFHGHRRQGHDVGNRHAHQAALPVVEPDLGISGHQGEERAAVALEVVSDVVGERLSGAAISSSACSCEPITKYLRLAAAP